MTLEQWNMVIGVNLTGQFLCQREAAREFLRRGVASTKVSVACRQDDLHEFGAPGDPLGRPRANYASSKGGIKLLMESMAQELAPHRIRVNAIGPGAIRTPINTSDAWNTPDAYARA